MSNKIEETLELIKTKNKELQRLDELILEISIGIARSDRYVNEKDKYVYHYKMSVFAKLFKKYTEVFGRDLSNYVELDYKKNMMEKILVVVTKYRDELRLEITTLLNI